MRPRPTRVPRLGRNGALAIALAATVASAAIAAAQRRPPPAPRSGGRGHGSITEGIECSACHTPAGWTLAGGSGDGGFDHARTGFPLTGRHRTVACTTCHTPGRQITRECASCHRDEHDGRLGRTCTACHSSLSWQDTHDIETHQLTRLPLTGMHALADCADCHRRTGNRRWSAVPADCWSCHRNDYLRSDVHPSHVDAGFSRDCAACHLAAGWSPAVVDPSALGSATGGLRAPPGHDLRFPLSFGAHRDAPCTTCHVSPDVPAALRCTGCHAHSPVRLRGQHRSIATPGEGAACLGCHPGGVGR